MDVPIERLGNGFLGIVCPLPEQTIPCMQVARETVLNVRTKWEQQASKQAMGEHGAPLAYLWLEFRPNPFSGFKSGFAPTHVYTTCVWALAIIYGAHL